MVLCPKLAGEWYVFVGSACTMEGGWLGDAVRCSSTASSATVYPSRRYAAGGDRTRTREARPSRCAQLYDSRFTKSPRRHAANQLMNGRGVSSTECARTHGSTHGNYGDRLHKVRSVFALQIACLRTRPGSSGVKVRRASSLVSEWGGVLAA